MFYVSAISDLKKVLGANTETINIAMINSDNPMVLLRQYP